MLNLPYEELFSLPSFPSLRTLWDARKDAEVQNPVLLCDWVAWCASLPSQCIGWRGSHGQLDVYQHFPDSSHRPGQTHRNSRSPELQSIPYPVCQHWSRLFGTCCLGHHKLQTSHRGCADRWPGRQGKSHLLWARANASGEFLSSLILSTKERI